MGMGTGGQFFFFLLLYFVEINLKWASEETYVIYHIDTTLITHVKSTTCEVQ